MFFDVEKAFIMLWREDLFIKMHQLRIERNMLNWIMVFFKWKNYSE